MNFINDLETNRHCSQFLTLTVNFRNIIHDFFRIITILIYRLSSRFACHCLLPPKNATRNLFLFNIVYCQIIHSQHFQQNCFIRLLFCCSSVSHHAKILVLAFSNRTAELIRSPKKPVQSFYQTAFCALFLTREHKPLFSKALCFVKQTKKCRLTFKLLP